MIRTQLYLPRSLVQRITLEAPRAQKPKAAIVRELLNESFAMRATTDAPNALRSLIALGQQFDARGPVDLSARLDDYLYADDDAQRHIDHHR
jgi:hypothetical protein